MIEKNSVYNSDNVEFLKNVPDNHFDLILTSPPYGDLRNYKGFSFDFENLAKEMKRCLKPTGFICWNEGSSFQQKNFSLLPFKHCLYFVEELGMLHHETLIFGKKSTTPGKSVKYKNCHEYVFVFTKEKTNTKNLILQKTKKKKQRKVYSKKFDDISKSRFGGEGFITSDAQVHGNVFFYPVGWQHSYKDEFASQHSAVMNINLAKDLVYSYSKRKELVFDPFGGSGTTGVAAKLLDRDYILTEISKEYCDLALQRIEVYEKSACLNEYKEERDPRYDDDYDWIEF